LDITVWTDASGRKAALNILNRLHALLHLGTLTVSGYQPVTVRVEHARTELTEVADNLKGTMRVRVTMLEV